jgi:hypothetical protein
MFVTDALVCFVFLSSFDANKKFEEIKKEYESHVCIRRLHSASISLIS